MKEMKMLLFGLSFIFLVVGIVVWANGEKSAAADANETYKQIQLDIKDMNDKTLKSFETMNQTLGVLNATLLNTNQRLVEIDNKHNKRGDAADLDLQRFKEKLDKMHTRAVPTTNNIKLSFTEPIPIQVIHPSAEKPTSPTLGSATTGKGGGTDATTTTRKVPSTKTNGLTRRPEARKEAQ